MLGELSDWIRFIDSVYAPGDDAIWVYKTGSTLYPPLKISLSPFKISIPEPGGGSKRFIIQFSPVGKAFWI